MAQDRSQATCLYSGNEPGIESEPRVSQGEHSTVDPMQSARCHPLPDLVVGQAAGIQVGQRKHARLAGGNFGDPVVDGIQGHNAMVDVSA